MLPSHENGRYFAKACSNSDDVKHAGGYPEKTKVGDDAEGGSPTVRGDSTRDRHEDTSVGAAKEGGRRADWRGI